MNVPEKTLCILGRQPALGRAELEAVVGAAHMQLITPHLIVVDQPLSSATFDRLGGTIKTAHLISQLETSSWPAIENFVKKQLPSLLNLPSKGKLQLGISTYELDITPAKVQALGLTLKKLLRTEERTVRLIPNKANALSTAQILHNHLTGRHGCELIIYRIADQTLILQTTHEQNINSYTLRDRERPKRDARVGMLPPKLAQILVNLATGPTINSNTIVLDPFCGTGVVLQEAVLMGCTAYGTDLEPRMITYTQANLKWLDQTFHTEVVNTHLAIGDATSYKWDHPFTAVAGESYLGQPLSRVPEAAKLQTIIQGCNLIISKFLRNIAAQCPAGTRFCLAVPAWQVQKDQFKHLPLTGKNPTGGLDHLEGMGYNRVKFEHVLDEDLLYYRPDQIVARELLVLIRK